MRHKITLFAFLSSSFLALIYTETTDDMLKILKTVPAQIPAKLSGHKFGAGKTGFKKLVQNLDSSITEEREHHAQALSEEQKARTTCETKNAKLQQELAKTSQLATQEVNSLQNTLAKTQKITEEQQILLTKKIEELQAANKNLQATLDKTQEEHAQALKQATENAQAACKTPTKDFEQKTKDPLFTSLSAQINALNALTQQVKKITPKQIRPIKEAGFISAAWELVQAIRSHLEANFAQ